MLLRNGKKYINIENNSFRKILLSEKNPKGKLYKINIDFDESSREWRRNKIYMGCGVFKYK
tara:strand:+ start:380 stop:562 length:183 start_codon:yes stop_codon:yes gene_type:complete